MTEAIVRSSGPVLRIYRCGRVETESAAGVKEERDHSSEENDGDEKQDEGPKREALCRGLNS
jgi:hypothetical protein